MADEVIRTRTIAYRIVKNFEDILSKYNIHIPSPEDDDREPDEMIGLYGSTYSELIDSTETEIINALEQAGVSKDKYITGKY